MGIRKNARLNATSASNPQVHDCGFNQSPWDIMTEFSPPSSPMLFPPPSSPMLFPPSPKVNEYAMIETSDASISIVEWKESDDDVSGKEFDCKDSDAGGGGGGKVGALCCGFNQSPWDIMTEFSPPSSPMPFPPPSSPMLFPPSPKVNEYAMIETSDASISIVEWEESADDVSGKEFDCKDTDAGGGGGGKVGALCCKTDGKKWLCMRAATHGNKFCEHHLALASKLSNDKNKKSAVIVKYAAVVNTESGKKRDRAKKPKEPSYTKVMTDGLDYAEDDNDEGEEAGLGKNKRARKTIKTRSLKSLM